MAVPNIINVQSLIDRAGSVQALAAVARVSRTAVIGWRTAGFIPGHRVTQICDALRLRPKEVQAVMRLVQIPKPRSGRRVPHNDKPATVAAE